MRSLLFALALLYCGCKSSKSKLEDKAPASSTPASDGSGVAAQCDDTELRSRAHEALFASKRYFDALQQHAATWSSDCAAVSKDLETLEPDGEAFVAAMSAAKDWAKSLPPACSERIQTFGEADPLELEIEKHTPALEARVAATYKTCHDFPGFEEASRKGIRLLEKKR